MARTSTLTDQGLRTRTSAESRVAYATPSAGEVGLALAERSAAGMKDAAVFLTPDEADHLADVLKAQAQIARHLAQSGPSTGGEG
jgi:hypothetical protein